MCASDVLGNLMGLQHYKPFWMYFVAFAVIIFGLIVYFWSSTREFCGRVTSGGSMLTLPFSRIAGKGRTTSALVCSAEG